MKNYAAGGNGRIWNIGLLSGTNPENSNKFLDTGVFGGPQSGTLYEIPVQTPHDIVSGGPIYRLDKMKRDYSIIKDYGLSGHSYLAPSGIFERENPELSSYIAPITDFQQMLDLTFNLTTETRKGIEWKPNVDDGMGTFFNDFYEPFPEVSRPTEWDRALQKIAVYYPSGEVTAEFPCLSTEVDRLVGNLTFNFERQPIVYGINKVPLGKTDEELHLFVKETPSDQYDEHYKWPFSGLVYGQADYQEGNLPFAYVLEQDMNYDINYIDQRWDNNDEVHWVNPFKLKNMYNANWNTEIYDRTLLEGARNYLAIGETQTTLWLRYKYIRDYDYYQGETPDPGREEFAITPSQRYDLIERVKGLYKYSGYHLRKSNVFSIEIDNSGLYQAVSGDFTINGQLVMTEDEVKAEIQRLVKEEINDMMRKITPSYTQLWKINWKGK